jgi:hypothetical protein
MNAKIEQASEVIKSALLELELEEPVVSELVFHLTDWVNDLSRFCDILERPEDYLTDLRRVSEVIVRFVAHVPNHLREADRLLIGFLETEDDRQSTQPDP